MAICTNARCKKSFEAKRAWQKYCSEECRNKHHGAARYEGLSLRDENARLRGLVRQLGGDPDK